MKIPFRTSSFKGWSSSNGFHAVNQNIHLFSLFPILPPYISMYFILHFSSKLFKPYIFTRDTLIHSLGSKLEVFYKKPRTSNWDKMTNEQKTAPLLLFAKGSLIWFWIKLQLAEKVYLKTQSFPLYQPPT